MQLTAKQERFVEEYLVDFNATQAAIRAGYSEKTANEQAARLLAKVNIAEAVQAGQKRLSEKTGITAERVLQEYAKIAFSDMRDYMAWGAKGIKLKNSEELTEEQAAVISEIVETTSQYGGSMKLKLHDKKGALDSIAKHLGMFVEKVEHSGPSGGAIEVNNRNKTEEELNARIAELLAKA